MIVFEHLLCYFGDTLRSSDPEIVVDMFEIVFLALKAVFHFN